MKVALVSRRYPPLIGGAERVLSYLGSALAAQGLDVTILTARIDPALPAVEVAPVAGAGSLRVERLPTSPLRVVGTVLYLRSLARWFARNKVDLAYVSMLKHDAYAVLGAARRLGFPVVLRPEGAGATGDIAWQGWGRFGSTIARRCRRADAVVAISTAVRRELEADGYAADRIHDLPNGVPVPTASWERSDDALRAAFVGRLASEKGVDALVAAWPLVVEEIPDARLTLIGEGPERPRLEGLVRDLGLGTLVNFTGSLADPLVELRRSTMFVLPSREEGMSIALLEAMSLGIPTVASLIPGNRALIETGVQGRLAAPDDPLALAREIIAHHRDPQAATMGEAARTRVQAEYSIAAVARRHIVLFEKLLAQPR